MPLNNEMTEFLQESLLVDDKIVTFKGLSRKFDIQMEEAQKCLEEFYRENCTKLKLDAAYYVSGEIEKKSGMIHHFAFLVPEYQIEAKKKLFSKFFSCHIYSLHRTKIQDLGPIYSADLDPKNFYLQKDIKNSSIKFPSGSRRKEVVEVFAETEKKIQTKSSPAKKIEEKSPFEKKENQKNEKSEEKSKPAEKEKIVKNSKEEKSANFFGKVAKSKEPMEVDQEKERKEEKKAEEEEEEEIIEPTPRPPKNSKKQAAKTWKTPFGEEKKKPKEKTPEPEEKEKEEDDEEKEEKGKEKASKRGSKRKAAPKESIFFSQSDLFTTGGDSSPECSPAKLRRSPRKHEGSQGSQESKASNEISQGSKDSKKSKGTSKSSRSRVPDSDDENPEITGTKKSGRRSRVPDSDDENPGKKETKKSGRRSRVPYSDDENPDIIPPTQRKKEKMPEKGKKGQQVTRTFMDDEGYLVTKKVWEEEEVQPGTEKTTKSQENEEKEKEEKNSKKFSPMKEKEKEKKVAPAKKQQASITSFFKKT